MQLAVNTVIFQNKIFFRGKKVKFKKSLRYQVACGPATARWLGTTDVRDELVVYGFFTMLGKLSKKGSPECLLWTYWAGVAQYAGCLRVNEEEKALWRYLRKITILHTGRAQRASRGLVIYRTVGTSQLQHLEIPWIHWYELILTDLNA